MEIYKAHIKKTKYGYLAIQKEFGFSIDADTIENAISAVKEQIEQLGVLRLKNGQPLPKTKLQIFEKKDIDDTEIVFVQTDIRKRFRDAASESVRKNISMPAWMDMQLRYYNVDASKLFQEAAVAFLEKKEQPKRITSVEELVKNVDKDVLNNYVIEKLTR